jgi:replicative DNA helicase
MTLALDADYATLGGLMLAPDTYDQVAGWLRPEDFAHPVCGEVYELIGHLRAGKVPVDPVTVLGALRDRGRVRADGYPASELIAMVEAVPVPQATPHYARQVLAAAVFRRVEACGTRLAQVGRTRRGGTDDALGTATGALGALAEIRSRWEQASADPPASQAGDGRRLDLADRLAPARSSSTR